MRSTLIFSLLLLVLTVDATSQEPDAPGKMDEMIYIPAGEFIMGSEESPDGDALVHRVYLDAYYIDRYEVANGQYYAFWIADGGPKSTHTPESFGEEYGIGDWPEVARTKSNHPVVGVSWDDARAYCEWAGKRLLTEAEWEKAAKGGIYLDGEKRIRNPNPTRRYPWGDGWDGDRANNRESKLRTTAQAGSFPKGASPYGVLDMAGNVWEWAADWYDREYYALSPYKNPKGPSKGVTRVLRGGSWYYDRVYPRCASRGQSYLPALRLLSVGIRCGGDGP